MDMFISVSYLSANCVFHYHKNKKIKVELFFPSREAQSPVCSIFLSFNPQLPKIPQCYFLTITPQFYFARSRSFFPKYRLFPPLPPTKQCFHILVILCIYLILYNFPRAFMFIPSLKPHNTLWKQIGKIICCFTGQLIQIPR